MAHRRLEVVEVSVTRPHAPRLRGVVIHRSLDLDRAFISERRGIPVTTPLRTLVDAGAVLPKILVAEALDAAVARRLVTATAVEAELRRLAKKGRRGAGVLRAVLEERDCAGRSPSVLEARTRRMLRPSRLPQPVPELIAGPHGEFRLDFPWPEVLLDVEVDGWEWHSSYEAVRLGKQRNNALVGQGYAILIYDWKDVTRRPTAVRAEIERTYRERAVLLGKQTGA
jgi:very-short-patch-repair endonuclease